MPDVTFTVDGDTTAMVVNAKKGENAYKKIGDAAEQSGKKIAAAGVQMEHSGRVASNAFEKTAASMGRAMIGAAAIARAFSAAKDKAVELQSTMVALGTEKGGFALRGGRAAAAGGFNQGVVSSFIEQISPASQEERAGFIESLASADLGLSSQRFNEGLQAVSSGAFTSQQALEALKNGGDLNVQNRLSQMSPAALRELDTRRNLDAINARSRGSFGGDALRLGSALQQAGDLDSPGRASVRAAVSSLDFTGAGGVGVTANSGTNAAEVYMKETADATKQLASESKKLNFSATTDGL